MLAPALDSTGSAVTEQINKHSPTSLLSNNPAAPAHASHEHTRLRCSGRGVLVLARSRGGAWDQLAAFPAGAPGPGRAPGALIALAPGTQPAALLVAAGARLHLLELATPPAAAPGPAEPGAGFAASPPAAALRAGGPLPAWHPASVRAKTSSASWPGLNMR